jgi:hypothetical protein
MKIGPMLAIAAVVGVLAIAGAEGSRAYRAGQASAELDAAKKDAAKWKESAAKAVVIVKHDSVRVIRTATRYEELRDTLVLTDTVRVKETLAAADTAIHACRDMVSSCSLAIAAKDSQLVSLERQNAAIQKMIPGRLAKATTAAKWLIVGGAIGQLLKR